MTAENRGLKFCASEAGFTTEGVGHAVAGALPVIGPAAAHAGEQIAEGNVAGGLGEATGLLLPMPSVARAAGRGVKAVGQGVAATGRATARATPIIGGVVGGAAGLAQGPIGAMYGAEKGYLAGRKVLEFVQRLGANKAARAAQAVAAETAAAETAVAAPMGGVARFGGGPSPAEFAAKTGQVIDESGRMRLPSVVADDSLESQLRQSIQQAARPATFSDPELAIIKQLRGIAQGSSANKLLVTDAAKQVFGDQWRAAMSEIMRPNTRMP